MKVKTESGVSITVIPECSSKIMLFDRPVRAIELKKEEVSQISALLVSSLKMNTNAELESRHSSSTKVKKKDSR